LSKGVTWDWVSFPEYMAAAEKRGVGLNVGFIAALTPFRHYVMGEEAMARAATPGEIHKIRSLLGEAIEAGALGWSTSTLPQHIGYKARPLACRQASKEEFGSYARVLREKGRGIIQIALTAAPGILSDQEYELLDFLLRESGRPITWLALITRVDKPDACRESLRKAEPLIKRGAIPQVNCRPILARFALKEPFIFASFPSWKPAFNRPLAEQKRVYGDPAFRAAFRKEMAEPRIFTRNWGAIRVRDARLPEHQRLIGKNIAEIAKEQGKDPLDTFLDLALAEDLEMRFMVLLLNTDPAGVKELITDKRTMIGLSDGGAHVNLLCDAGYSTYLLGTWVRERQALTLEEAIRRLTLEPASFFDLSHRGRIAPGMAADLVVFDPQRVGCPEEPEMIYDLPGGEGRLVLRAEGVHYTVVNGAVLLEEGRHTGALPGQVLRSGTV
jgi:N-acyl-D-aspartate/D-glutamate deacylase